MSVLISRRGQVTIPKQVREYLGVGPGGRLDFEIGADGRVFLVRLSNCPRMSRESCYFGYVKGGMTTEEIMALIRGESRAGPVG